MWQFCCWLIMDLPHCSPKKTHSGKCRQTHTHTHGHTHTVEETIQRTGVSVTPVGFDIQLTNQKWHPFSTRDLQTIEKSSSERRQALCHFRVPLKHTLSLLWRMYPRLSHTTPKQSTHQPLLNLLSIDFQCLGSIEELTGRPHAVGSKALGTPGRRRDCRLPSRLSRVSYKCSPSHCQKWPHTEAAARFNHIQGPPVLYLSPSVNKCEWHRSDVTLS